MQTKNKLKNILLFSFIWLFISCNKDEPNRTIAPTVNYEETIVDVVYYLPSSTEPSVDWNGDIGTFQIEDDLASGDAEYSIDENTGEINWTRDLKDGIWDFYVKATNSAGTTTIPFRLDNRLDVYFIGTYTFGGQHYFKVEFHKDGTCSVTADDASATPAQGNWFKNNMGYIIVNYTSDNGDRFSLKGTINERVLEVTWFNEFDGTWFNEFDAVPGNEGGTFSIQYSI